MVENKYPTISTYKEYKKHPFYIEWLKRMREHPIMDIDKNINEKIKKCPHDGVIIIRKKWWKNKKNFKYEYQCMKCGFGVGLSLKRKLVNEDEIEEFDYNLQKKTMDIRNKKYKKNIEYISYNNFLNSDIWMDLKLKTFKIHGNKCNFCKRNIDIISGQVHHFNYDNAWGEENPEKDLRPICKECHEKIHLFGIDN